MEIVERITTNNKQHKSQEDRLATKILGYESKIASQSTQLSNLKEENKELKAEVLSLRAAVKG